VTGFLIQFFSDFGSEPVFGVDRFNDRFGSGNIVNVYYHAKHTPRVLWKCIKSPLGFF
jgi:hypothetical protein